MNTKISRKIFTEKKFPKKNFFQLKTNFPKRKFTQKNVKNVCQKKNFEIKNFPLKNSRNEIPSQKKNVNKKYFIRKKNHLKFSHRKKSDL